MINIRLREFCTDRSGAAIILATLMMPVLVGGMGLGAETGYRYYNHRLIQHAADVAAHAGAVRLARGHEDDIEPAATNIATNSGWAPPPVGVIEVNNPPLAGGYAGDSNAVEVYLTETRPRLFSAIFLEDPVMIRVRAVAAVDNTNASSGCILALSETASGAVTLTGSTSVNLAGCSVASNSSASDSFLMSGSGSSISADCVSTTGEAETTANLTLTQCETVTENAPAVQDPYYWVSEPDPTGITCESSSKVGKPNQTTDVIPTQTWTHPSGVVIPVMRFCNGLDAKGVVNFAPGLYIIENGTMTSSGTAAAQLNSVAGTTTYNNGNPGVTFYFTNGGKAKISANTTLNLSAPNSGPYSGILFFGSRSDPAAHSIQGSATSVVQGAIYAPASEVTFTGNSSTSSGCTQVIADTVVLTGSSELSSDCATAGTQEIIVGQVIAVVE